MNSLDYRIIQYLLSRPGRKDLPTLVDQEFDTALESLTLEESVYYLDRLAHESDILEKIYDLKLDDIIAIESALLSVLADMEQFGVRVNRSELERIGREIRSEIAHLEGAIYAIVGEIFNINSPKQIQTILFDKLQIKPLKKNKTGYSVDTEVLEEIAKEHEIARLILEYRILTKLDSTYVIGLTRAIASDGRIHTTYDSFGAATGRMSSNEPNLQNIPVGEGYANEIKACFVASENRILMTADYSQIELRILAFLSGERALIDAFKQGEDIHMRTARFLFGSEKTITSHERRIAKTVNFGVIYGITGFGLSKTLAVSPHDAQIYVNAFYEKYPGVRRYYDDLLERAREDGYVETFFGRRRYIPTLNDANKMVRGVAEREAMNMPVQGTAADIIKIAMIELDAKIREHHLDGAMILQVHDELVFDIPTHEEEIFRQIVRETMEGVFALQKWGIPEKIATIPDIPPITVDIGVGENWSTAKG